MDLPYRSPSSRPAGEGPAVRPDVPLPPEGMPMMRARRPLKRWRYIGAFCEEMMICVGSARVGPAANAWWAAWDRRTGVLHGRTWLRRGGVRFSDGGVVVRDGDTAIELRVDEGSIVETICQVGDTAAYTWTQKQAARPVRGRIALPGAPVLGLRGLAVVDDSAGYHPRRTSWFWSAGVGEAADGHIVGWNLVTGINDPEHDSERTIWIDELPFEPPPVRFDGLTGIDGANGERLDFTPEATRARHDNLLLVSSDYEQPFGTFAGVLPGGVELRSGMGVMERHEARW